MSPTADHSTTTTVPNGSCKTIGGEANSGARIFSPSADEEICITGLAGSFPSCRNVADLEHNLYNKVDFVLR